MALKKLSSSRAKNKAKDLSVEEQEQALAKIKKGKSKKTQRVTVDFPYEIYGDMKEVVEEEGKTLKGYIVSLVKKDLKSKNT